MNGRGNTTVSSAKNKSKDKQVVMQVLHFLLVE
jgi:hypothetical protein